MLTTEKLEEIEAILDNLFDGYTIEQSDVKLLKQLYMDFLAVKEGYLQQLKLSAELLDKNQMMRNGLELAEGHQFD